MAENYNQQEIGTGIGAAAGAAAGSFIPVIGTTAGAKLGSMAGSAIGGMIEGNARLRDAEKNRPSENAPLTAAMLEDVRRRRRALQTGMGLSPLRKDVRETMSTTQRNIMRRSGGQVGSALTGLAMAQGSASKQLNDIQIKAMQIDNQLASQEMAMAKRMEDRKMMLQLARYKELQTQGLEQQSVNQQNVLATIANLGEMDFSSLGGGNDISQTPVALKDTPSSMTNDLNTPLFSFTPSSLKNL